MNHRAAALAVAVGLPCAASQAALFFTFQDPGPAREFTAQENVDDSWSFSYSASQLVSLSITASEGEIPNTTFSQTRVTMNVQTSTSPIVDQPDLLVTEISGTFTFEDVSGMSPVTILTGTFDEAIATLLISNLMGSIEASGSATGDTAVGSLQLTAGDAISDLFGDPSLVLGGRQTASFALSELTGSEDGGLATLIGSAAFTGSSEGIPSPGAFGLFAAASLAALRRRR